MEKLLQDLVEAGHTVTMRKDSKGFYALVAEHQGFAAVYVSKSLPAAVARAWAGAPSDESYATE